MRHSHSRAASLGVRACALTALTAVLAACSGGGAGTGAPPATTPAQPGQSVQRVTGTLSIAGDSAQPSGHARMPAGLRRPDYISYGTKHVALFIDGASTAAGSTAYCSHEEGDGTGCTLSWSATLSVPAPHTFSVETDDGTYLLSVGQAIENVTSGPNANFATLALNGVASYSEVTVNSCSGSSCNGTYYLLDADMDPIYYAGSTTVPTQGQNPTSGTVFDNNGGGSNDINISSDSPQRGTISGGSATGLGQTSGANTYSKWNSGVLTFVGVLPIGGYSFVATCAAGATGAFGIEQGGGFDGSGDVTTAQTGGIGQLNPADGDTFPSEFSCNNGTITPPAAAASGAVPIE